MIDNFNDLEDDYAEYEQIKELITRRRRQMLVHSIIYYKLNDNLISDSKWSQWALELENLQNEYPEIASQCPYAEEFAEFNHSSGMNLPLDDDWAYNKALQLLKWSGKI